MPSSFKNCLLIALCGLVSGCSWFHMYRPNIQQGNVYDQTMVDRLKPGMTQDQVRYIMGTPVLNNTLESDRWDYVYSFQQGGKPRKQKDIALYFNPAGLLQRIEIAPLKTAEK